MLIIVGLFLIHIHEDTCEGKIYTLLAQQVSEVKLQSQFAICGQHFPEC